MDEFYSAEMGFDTDEMSLVAIRSALDKTARWGWYIWDRSSIARVQDDSEEIPETRPTNRTRRATGKDIIYQKWRAKYNNDNLTHTEEGKERKRLSREKTFTGRKLTKVSKTNNGDSQSAYGTLVGCQTWAVVSNKIIISFTYVNYTLQVFFISLLLISFQVPQQNKLDFSELVRNIKESTSPTAALANKLARMWETQYPLLNAVKQEDFAARHTANNLATVKDFLYFEAYASKICQLERHSDTRMAARLYSLAEILPKIYENGGYQPLVVEHYKNMPLVSTLMAISHFFKECMRFLLAVATRVNSITDVMEEVGKTPLCNVIVDYDFNEPRNLRRFGVASQGVPFIKNLTEEQAVFVFATSPDVFGYAPDKDRQPKQYRINSLIEFLRRYVLGIQDKTETPGLEKIKE
jgi:hypothetical protein